MPAPTLLTVKSAWSTWPSSSTTDTMTGWLSPWVTNTTSGLAVICVGVPCSRSGLPSRPEQTSAPKTTIRPFNRCIIITSAQEGSPEPRSNTIRSRFRYSAMSSSAATPTMPCHPGSPASFNRWRPSGSNRRPRSGPRRCSIALAPAVAPHSYGWALPPRCRRRARRRACRSGRRSGRGRSSSPAAYSRPAPGSWWSAYAIAW